MTGRNPSAGKVVSLFDGAGGWQVAASALDIGPVLGIEWDANADATCRAAGFNSLLADVAALDPADFAPCVGLIASPPCQAFSMAGKGEGRAAMDAYRVAIASMAAGEPVAALDEASGDPRGHLVLEPLRWALALLPRWVALEQVPPVLPLWEAYAGVLRARGYGVWVGLLDAEQYGVPQTRRRAILIASLDRDVRRPQPTHQRYIAPRGRKAAAELAESMDAMLTVEPERVVHREDRELLPWVSMAEALGWGMTARPSVSLLAKPGGTGGHRPLEGGSGARETLRAARADGDWAPNDLVGFPRRNDDPDGVALYRQRDLRPASEPAFALTEKARSWSRLRAGTGANDASRAADEPAPTIRFGARLNDVSWIVEPDTSPHPTHYDRRQQKDGVPVPLIPVDRPAPTLGSAGQSRGRDVWVSSRPATTVNGDPRIAEPGRHDPAESGSQYGPATVRVTIEEAAALQSFPPDYPWQGSKTARFQQVGNAIPPLLAWHVLRAAM